MIQLPPQAARVADLLLALGHKDAPVLLDQSARTAKDAADALGVQLGQIVKTIVFRRIADNVAVIIPTSGDRRVDETKVAALTGDLGRADAAFVKKATGYSIGGVSPVGLLNQPIILIDQDLFRFDIVWAAAGHPNAVFPLNPDDLARFTNAPVVDVTVTAPTTP